MNKEEVDEIVEKYKNEGIESSLGDWNQWGAGGSQYDDNSAIVNYSFVRHFKPTRVIEFGARTGRCTHDILLALLRNKKKFVFRSYELSDDLRILAQAAIDHYFGKDSIKIGGDVTLAEDIPDNLDYIFVDNCHDWNTTAWVFQKLLPKCKKGALVHFHDIKLHDNYEGEEHVLEEADYIRKIEASGKNPLKKLFWYWDYGQQWESAWFTYEP